MDYTVIVLILVVSFGLYYMYRLIVPLKSIVANKIYLPTLSPPYNEISMDKLTNPASANYTFDFWIYVNAYPSDQNSSIQSGFYGGDSPYGNIMYIEPTSSQYNFISIDLHKEGVLAFYNGNWKPSVSVPNFPLQRWVYVIISVKNTVVDLYIDGLLMESNNIKSDIVIQPTTKSILYFGRVLDAYITGMNRITKYIDTNMAYTNYFTGKALLNDDNFIKKSFDSFEYSGKFYSSIQL